MLDHDPGGIQRYDETASQPFLSAASFPSDGMYEQGVKFL